MDFDKVLDRLVIRLGVTSRPEGAALVFCREVFDLVERTIMDCPLSITGAPARKKYHLEGSVWKQLLLALENEHVLMRQGSEYNLHKAFEVLDAWQEFQDKCDLLCPIPDSEEGAEKQYELNVRSAIYKISSKIVLLYGQTFMTKPLSESFRGGDRVVDDIAEGLRREWTGSLRELLEAARSLSV